MAPFCSPGFSTLSTKATFGQGAMLLHDGQHRFRRWECLLQCLSSRDLNTIEHRPDFGPGVGIGYIGGGALLAINLIMLKYPGWLGFPEGYFTVQDCFLSVALWWLIFSLPTFLF